MSVVPPIGPTASRKECSCLDRGRAKEITAKSQVSITPSIHGTLLPIGCLERAVCDNCDGSACARVGGGAKGTRNEEASHALPLIQHEDVIEGGRRHEGLVGKEMQNPEMLNRKSELSASPRA